ncbi:hypothetical protein FB451DRAFT_1197453 [Mycena latifolia]|nr:hypothetical protein FB451DRAFT_1197453 [Mycena latifolia]
MLGPYDLTLRLGSVRRTAYQGGDLATWDGGNRAWIRFVAHGVPSPLRDWNLAVEGGRNSIEVMCALSAERYELSVKHSLSDDPAHPPAPTEEPKDALDLVAMLEMSDADPSSRPGDVDSAVGSARAEERSSVWTALSLAGAAAAREDPSGAMSPVFRRRRPRRKDAVDESLSFLSSFISGLGALGGGVSKATYIDAGDLGLGRQDEAIEVLVRILVKGASAAEEGGRWEVLDKARLGGLKISPSGGMTKARAVINKNRTTHDQAMPEESGNDRYPEAEMEVCRFPSCTG